MESHIESLEHSLIGLPSIEPSPPDDPLARCPECRDGRMPGSGFDWSFVDGVYCISLRHREDRARATWGELHRIGLCSRAVFHRPGADRSPKRGCWESHRAAACDARARGLSRVLVLEDDVVFERSLDPATVARVGAALAALPSDWMAFYLGHWVLWAYPVGRRVLRCSSLCTHAYVASERLLDWLSETPFERGRQLPQRTVGGKGIDASFAALPGMYSFFPMLAVQRLVPNDHLRAPAIRFDHPRHLVRDLAVRSGLREFAMAHLMRVNEKIVLALTPAMLLGRWLRRGFTASRRDVIEPAIPACSSHVPITKREAPPEASSPFPA